VAREVGNTMPAMHAVGLASLAAALAAVDAVIVRALGGSLHPFVIGFFRTSFDALVVLPWVIARRGVLRSAYPLPQNALRAALRLLALVCFFAEFSQGQLTGVTVIAFISPIFVVIGASAMLGERLTLPVILAVLASFVGALLVIRPDGAPSLGLGFALVGAVLKALIQLVLKYMPGGDRTNTFTWNPTWLGGAVICGSALLAMQSSHAAVPEIDNNL